MQANLENLGTLERRLRVALPMAEIDNEVDTRLKKLTRTVKMHGFRPGKVPQKVVKQFYGGQVRDEVFNRVAADEFLALGAVVIEVAGGSQVRPAALGDLLIHALLDLFGTVLLAGVRGDRGCAGLCAQFGALA